MPEQEITGQCMCGAVTVTSILVKPMLRACHCQMCQRQNSGAFVSIANDAQNVTTTGPITVYRSSEWAERAFCPTCGSTLWYGTVHDGAKNLSAGLFDNAAGATLGLEFFNDNCPQGYAFEGDHKKLSAKETIKLFTGEDV